MDQNCLKIFHSREKNSSCHYHEEGFLPEESPKKVLPLTTDSQQTLLLPTTIKESNIPVNNISVHIPSQKSNNRIRIQRYSRWNVVLLVIRWIKQLKRLVFHNLSFRSLTSYHYEIFRDLNSDDYESLDTKKSCTQRTSLCLSKFWESFPIISPHNKLRFLWDFIIMISMLFHFFFIVFDLTFDDSKFHRFYIQWLCILALLLPLDMLVKVNSGFFEKGAPIHDRKRIWKKYKEAELYYDLIFLLTLICHILFEKYMPNTHYIHIIVQSIYFIRYQLFQHLLDRFEEGVLFDEKIEAIVSLSKLFFKMLFFAHCVACFWFFIGHFYENDEESWLVAKNITGKSHLNQYIVSLYWAITTISTTGYGDITPQNEGEYVFAVFVMILGSLYFGYSLTYIGEVFSKLKKEHNRKKKNQYLLNKLMKKNGVEFGTQIEIRRYMNFLWDQEEKEISAKENDILNKFSHELKDKFLTHTLGRYLRPIKLFSSNFSEKFQQKLLTIMKPVNFDTNSFIYQKGDQKNCAIYIIVEGEAALVYGDRFKGDLILEKFKNGDSFGEVEFFTGESRKFSVKSYAYSRGFAIFLDDFLGIIKDFSEDYEQYNFMKDRLMFSGDINLLFKVCASCGKNSHSSSNCPFFDPFPNRFHFINKHRCSPPQVRAPFSRSFKMKTHALLNRSKIHSLQRVFAENIQNNEDFLKIESLKRIMPESCHDLFIDQPDVFYFTDVETHSIKEAEASELMKKISSVPRTPKAKSFLTEMSQIEEEKSLFEESVHNIIEPKALLEHRVTIDLSDPKDIKSLSEIDMTIQKNLATPQNLKKSFEKMLQLNKAKSLSNDPGISNNFLKMILNDDFDRMKSFSKYFPNFNFKIITMQINKVYYYKLKENLASKKNTTIKSAKSSRKSILEVTLNSGRSARKLSVFNKSGNNLLNGKRFSGSKYSSDAIK